MDIAVNITTKGEIYEIFCPHYCLLCGQLGKIVCNRCKNYNIADNMNECLNCGGCIDARCDACELPYDASWLVGRRNENLGLLVNAFKFQSVRAIGAVFAEMLDGTLPCLSGDIIVVPVPTIRKHIRERGLDHTLLIAKNLARIRGWRYEKTLKRISNTVQVGADGETRKRQAKSAYGLARSDCAGKSYLVVDDVCTTGASLRAVCGLLKEAGAKRVMVAVIAKSGNK